MTNPPMEWGYPRTVQGFFHALTRGQYEKINPTNIIAHPDTFMVQLWLLVKGVADAFNWVYMFFALLPFLFFSKMKRRERNWLITVAAIYPFLGVLLTIFLNPQKDRQSVELLRVFFAASHTVVAIFIGYGLALTAAYMATHYEKFRRWAWLGGADGAGAGLFLPVGHGGQTLFGAGRGGERGGSAALGGAGLCAGAIRPAHFRRLDLDRAAGDFSWGAGGLSHARAVAGDAGIVRGDAGLFRACRIGITASSGGTGLAIGSGTTCSRRRSRGRTAS